MIDFSWLDGPIQASIGWMLGEATVVPLAMICWANAVPWFSDITRIYLSHALGVVI